MTPDERLSPDEIDAESEGDSSLRIFMYRNALEAARRRTAALEFRLARVLRVASDACDVCTITRPRGGPADENNHGRVWSGKRGTR